MILVHAAPHPSRQMERGKVKKQMQTNPVRQSYPPASPLVGMVLTGAPIPIARMGNKTALRFSDRLHAVERAQRGLPNSCSAAGPANFTRKQPDGPSDK